MAHGNQLPRYDLSMIDHIYGVKPNVDLYDTLYSNIKKYSLSNIYIIVSCIIKDFAKLKKYGLKLKTIDTIISV